jgi:hypothetical protein
MTSSPGKTMEFWEEKLIEAKSVKPDKFNEPLVQNSIDRMIIKRCQFGSFGKSLEEK